MKYLILISLITLFGCKETVEVKPTVPPVVIQEPLNTSSLDQPWKNSESSIVIDAYELNNIDWNKMANDKKMVGVIHRSSIGLKKDLRYEERKKEALNRGYLWGAYHLGKRGDTIKQAELFISMANDNDTMMFLDLEDTSSASMMSIDESVNFMEYVLTKTGKVPSVYANHSVTLKLNEKLKSHALFKSSKLWYARFKPKVTDFPLGVWNNYFLWQFSSEINCTKTGSCLYNVPGTLFDMDVNVFYGTKEQLKSKWNNEV